VYGREKSFSPPFQRKKKKKKRLKRAGVQNFQSQSVENSSLFQSSLSKRKSFFKMAKKLPIAKLAMAKTVSWISTSGACAVKLFTVVITTVN
jgi:hypothetical protein